MGNYVSGCEYPIFSIRNSTGQEEQRIELDLTMEGGLVESYADNSIKKFNIKGDGRKINQKKRVTFTLHYDSNSKKANTLSLQAIINAEENGKKIWLYPRADLMSRNFEVMFTGTPFDIGINTGGNNTPGNRLLILSWETRKLVTVDWRDPDLIDYVVNRYEAIAA